MNRSAKALLALFRPFPVFAILGQPGSLLTIVFLCCLATVSGARAPSWKPEAQAGSARFEINQVEAIILPADPDDRLLASVQDFVDIFEARTGRALKVLTEGRPKNTLSFGLEPNRVEAGGGFRISVDRTRVSITSRDTEGWALALYTIAHQMLGARWFWGGDLGFEWGPVQRKTFPRGTWVERPAFIQRQFHPVHTDYARRNRLNQRFNFNHNLARVFDEALFVESPEVFAEVHGFRRPPRGSNARDPQPDFTKTRTVEIAARAALDYFATSPQSVSFSLSVNDNVLFDNSARTEAAVSPVRFFRGRPDYTDLVFGFMNQVAERVFEEGGAWQTPSGEDRYLTALAYYWTEAAPTIPIHPRVMPVLTSDRAQWHDPQYRAEDKALIRAWSTSGAERIATWDYYFGAPYPYPRQFNQWIGESLRYLADSGVDVLFSQLPAFWGLDGAKPWLGAQLLWDPYQDSDDLLQEFYQYFFGPAAEPMHRFYKIAESYRNENEGRAEWIKLYKDESGIALFSDAVLGELRLAIEKAARLAAGADLKRSNVKSSLPPDRFVRRVEVVSQAFRFTEIYAAYYRARSALVFACLDSPSAPALILAKLLNFQEARAAYQDYFEFYFTEGVETPQRRHLELNQSDPEGLARGILDGAPSWEAYSLLEDTRLLHSGTTRRDFIGPELPVINGWFLDYRPGQRFAVLPSQHGSGATGLRSEGADMVSIFRTLPVVSNCNYLWTLHASWRVSLDNRIHLQADWIDRDGRIVKSEIPLRIPIENRPQPISIYLPLTAPDNAYDVRLRILNSRQAPGDYFDLSEIDFAIVPELP